MRYCSLASGSSGNAHYIEGGGTAVIVDIGLSMKALKAEMMSVGLDPTRVAAVFVTHEHIDHIKGIGPWCRKYKVPVFATAGTWQGIGKSFGKAMPGYMFSVEADRDYQIGEMTVHPFALHHDAREPVGYRFSVGGEVTVVLTDNGYLCESLRAEVLRADIVALEANHDVSMLLNGSYPYSLKKRIYGSRGHLSNIDCAMMVCELLKTKPDAKICLSHLSRENNTPEIALRTVLDAVHETLGTSDLDGQISVSQRDHASAPVETEDLSC